MLNFYRPHPKDDGRLYFQFVCQFTWGGGYPLHRSRWGGYSFPGPGGGYPFQLMGGTPSSWWGVPPAGVTPWQGVTPLAGVSPSHQSSIACTCFAAGGMLLAFTQEDFLVTKSKLSINLNLIFEIILIRYKHTRRQTVVTLHTIFYGHC